MSGLEGKISGGSDVEHDWQLSHWRGELVHLMSQASSIEDKQNFLGVLIIFETLKEGSYY